MKGYSIARMMKEGALQVSMRRQPRCSVPLLVAAVVFLTGALVVAGPNLRPGRRNIEHTTSEHARHKTHTLSHY